MNTRIAKILKEKALSNKAFAELLGIQRSGVSHLLSGRNKPSIDFVIKLINQFPEISMKWLILGKGEMYSTPTPPQFFSKEEKKNITDKNEEKEKLSGVLQKIPPQNKATEIEKIILLMKDGSFRVFQ